MTPKNPARRQQKKSVVLPFNGLQSNEVDLVTHDEAGRSRDISEREPTTAKGKGIDLNRVCQ